MTSAKESSEPRSRTLTFLPWGLAIAGLLLYLLTLNHWVSLLNLLHVSRAAHLTWQPELYAPVYYLLTYPIRWLSPGTVPLAMNLFSAVCGALALGQLARTVMLLPHDRTQDQRDRQSHSRSLLGVPLAWLPPLVAVVACGLQRSFWEHGTNGTREMLDILMFGYVIRSLLEYRVDGRESRLYCAALVQGAGMTGNLAMVGFAPLFIVALVWLRGMKFLQLAFLVRLFVFGLAGLSLYLLLPLIAVGSKSSNAGLWEMLQGIFHFQYSFLRSVPFSKARLLHGLDEQNPLWVLALSSLLPLLLIAIRWPSHFGDTSRVGTAVTKWVLHFAHVFLLIFCVWVTFDSPLSPRYAFGRAGGLDIPYYPLLRSEANPFGITGEQLSFACLSLQYLTALIIGYFAGYFLIVFQPIVSRGRRSPQVLKLVHQVATAFVGLVLAVLAVGLALRNLPVIRINNGPQMRQFAGDLVTGLPKESMIVADDGRRLLLAQAFLAASPEKHDVLPLDSLALSQPAYHRFLTRRYPGLWKALPDQESRTKLYEESEYIRKIQELALVREFRYLHPSFGIYFELFSGEPRGLSQRLTPAPINTLIAPRLTADTIQLNETYWNQFAETMQPRLVAALKTTPRNALAKTIIAKTHLPPQTIPQVEMMAAFYSRALVAWGVELQRANQFAQAAPRFEQALDLNPENVVAQVNLEYNKQYRAGNHGKVTLDRTLEDAFGKYRSWDQMLSENGPYDEPTFSYAQGFVFFNTRHYRQAAIYFDRVRQLVPNDFNARIGLAQAHLFRNLPDQTLKYTDEIRSLPDQFPIGNTNIASLISVEAGAYFQKNDPEKASQVIDAALKRFADDQMLYTIASQIYAQHHDFTRAQAVVERQLKSAPGDAVLLVNKAVVAMGLTNYDESIKILSQVLTDHPDIPVARIYRARALLEINRLDEAQQDYEVILHQFPGAPDATFGLHDIAFRRGNTAAAIEYGEQFVTNSAALPAQRQLVQSRLRDAKSGRPK